MSERIKRILYILLFVAIVILIGIALYFVFFRPTVPPVIEEPTPEFPGGLPGEPGVPPVEPEEPEEPGVFPPSVVVPPPVTPVVPGEPTISTTAEGGLVVPNRLFPNSAQHVAASSTTNGVNFYDASTGLFNRLTPDGEVELLSTRVFRDVQTVSWAPTTDKAVLEFPDGSNIIYNFATDESFTLPTQYEDFSFSPDSSQIAAKDLRLNPEDRWLVVVDDRGRSRQLVEHLGDNQDRVQVEWNPAGQIVATSAKSIDANRAEIIFLTKNGQQLTKALIQGRDLRYTYNQTGDKMAYSVYNATSNYLPTLWVTGTAPNAIDQGRINTGLNTWADKCTWRGATELICAVPNDIGELSGILQSENRSDDSIYSIDTRTGAARLIAQPLVSTTIASMTVGSDGTSLFYVEQSTGAINKLNMQTP